MMREAEVGVVRDCKTLNGTVIPKPQPIILNSFQNLWKKHEVQVKDSETSSE